MTSTTTGLPDRYRPLDQAGPDEPTPTGVIRSWRAKDRVLNRDVAIRVHTPGGPAAHAWIARALTAGGLATPALAMVYDAAEGTADEPGAPGSAAYVVNEWIDGETLAERLQRGPLPQREARTVIRRLAEGVAEAHRVGLAVGGLTAEHVVLRPNGLVGLRAVPAASGTVQGDITALGSLLEACLGGPQAVEAAGRGGRRGPVNDVPPDLAALVRRARSTEPGQGLSSVAAMVSLLNERPRTGPGTSPSGPIATDGWRRRDRRPEAADAAAGEPGTAGPQTFPPIPPAASPPAPGGEPEPTQEVPALAARSRAGWAAEDHDDDLDSVLDDGDDRYADDYDDRYADDYAADPYAGEEQLEEPGARRKLVVVGLPVLALAVVIALAWWFGTNVLSVAGSVDDTTGSTPPASSSVAAPGTGASASSAPPAGGPTARIVTAEVFDPEGDGQPENDREVPQSFDGDPSTAWSTLAYRGSPAFGNLKSGVGIVYDLGTAQPLTGVTITTATPGATVEVRTGAKADGDLDSFAVAAQGSLQGTTDLTFAQPVDARYVLVWVTGLVQGSGGYSADLAEVAVHTAG
jgi:eukaryotic-like serine/threonine-protein kinase